MKNGPIIPYQTFTFSGNCLRFSLISWEFSEDYFDDKRKVKCAFIRNQKNCTLLSFIFIICLQKYVLLSKSSMSCCVGIRYRDAFYFHLMFYYGYLVNIKCRGCLSLRIFYQSLNFLLNWTKTGKILYWVGVHNGENRSN